jgi:hypothetical protein
MKNTLVTTALASALVVGGLFAVPTSFAQDNEPCVGEDCPDMQGQGTHKKRMKGIEQNNQGEDESPDEMVPRKKKRVQSTQENDVDVDVQEGSSRRVRQADWKYNPDRHQRRRSKSSIYRFYLDGWWYPQPYWEVYGVGPYRISCGEGRAIVAARFYRVRVVECRGGIYTYLGRREGDTFRVLVNSRTGRIVGMDRI